jgi:hypothetical protein
VSLGGYVYSGSREEQVELEKGDKERKKERASPKGEEL